MGLSVAYYLEARGTKQDLLNTLHGLRDDFLRLQVRDVGRVVEIPQAALPFTEGSQDATFEQKQLGLAMLIAEIDRLDGPNADRDRAYWRARMDLIARTGNGLSLTVDVGPGCERFTLLLGRLGSARTWVGARSTKTQYAEHFVESHLAVIEMLRLCRGAGILRRACDDGGYWETGDLAVLAARVNASTAVLKAIPSVLKATGGEVRAAVEGCANYVRVEGEAGRK